MDNKRRISIGLVLLLLSGVGAWWLFADPGPDPEVEKLKETMKAAFDSRDSMTPAQRSQNREAIHQQMQSLSDEQRHELFSSMRERFAARMEQHLDEYFDAPVEQRTAILDKHIMEQEQRRREMEKRRLERHNDGEHQRPPAAQRGRWGRPGSRTPEQRQERMKSRLDNTDPKLRAKGAEYRNAMKKRRKELGLPERRHRH